MLLIVKCYEYRLCACGNVVLHMLLAECCTLHIAAAATAWSIQGHLGQHNFAPRGKNTHTHTHISPYPANVENLVSC